VTLRGCSSFQACEKITSNAVADDNRESDIKLIKL